MDPKTKKTVVIALILCFLMLLSSASAVAGEMTSWFGLVSSDGGSGSSSGSGTTNAAGAGTTGAAGTTGTPTPTPTPTPAATTPGFGKVNITSGNDSLTSEDVAFRPAWNHNMLTLPSGSDKTVGRCFFLNHTGGGDIQSTDGTQIYAPVDDNKTATGMHGSTYHTNNNQTYVITFDGTNWVIL